jgi:FAD binding domain/Aromatic-ring hydroxylase, C-terminal
VFFAGDAAHSHSPMGGQGVNLGIQDAVNLGWKLAATLRDRALEHLLDTYHTERHPVAARMLESIRAQGLLVNARGDQEIDAVRDLVIDLLRLPDANHHISGLMSGLDIQYPGMGPRMPDLDLETTAGPTRVHELLHSGRGVLLTLAGRAPAPNGWSDRVDSVEATTPEQFDAAAVLIRPDGYIAWRDTDGVPVETALDRWFGSRRTALEHDREFTAISQGHGL